MSDADKQVTNPSAFKKRSLVIQIVLAIVTLGFYTIYWFYVTHKQLNEGTSAEFSPGLRTVGLFIPIYNFVVIWRTSHDAEPVSTTSGPVVFLLFLVFPPASWYLIQSGINSVAAGN